MYLPIKKRIISVILICFMLMTVMLCSIEPVEALSVDSTRESLSFMVYLDDNAKTTWDFLKSKGFNDYAVAGIMGNLWAESGLNPKNLQGSYERRLKHTDESYTKAVDNGTYKNFVRDSAGYGLVQWTYHTRKQGLLNYAKKQGKSIGDLTMQLEYLYIELSGYTSVMNTLRKATSIRMASDAILTGYERPANQGSLVRRTRAGYGQVYYNKYAGSAPSPTPTPTPTPTPSVNVRRLYGETRYNTGFVIANQFKADAKLSKFKAIIIACGTDFPDALSAGYLSKVVNSPVLLWREKETSRIQNYIKQNVAVGGRVFLLGGSGVLSDSIRDGLSDYKVIRLGGQDRFETNITILRTSGVKGGEILVVDGTNYQNALVAAATGNPVLMVKGGGLKASQKEFLRSFTGARFTIVGNTASVSTGVESALAAYGSVSRISARTSDEISVKVAQKYFSSPTEVTLAINNNFPDALCGGTLCIVDKTPIMLVNRGNCSHTAAYINKLNLKRVTVLGGPGVLSDSLINEIC